jgi:hypothetical protein
MRPVLGRAIRERASLTPIHAKTADIRWIADTYDVLVGAYPDIIKSSLSKD